MSAENLVFPEVDYPRASERNYIINKFEGDAYSLGLGQGRAFAEDLREALRVIKNNEDMNAARPFFIPRSIFFGLASRKALNLLKKIYKKHAPSLAERIAGMAEGSGLPERILYLFSAAEIIMGIPDFTVPRTGCTSIIYRPEKYTEKVPVMSRNFDFEKFIVPFLFLRECKPYGKYRTYDMTAAVLPGTFNGFNEYGLCIATDEAFPLSEVGEGLPASAIIQETLENCKTSEDAFEFIRNFPRGSGNIFAVNDASGHLMRIEYTSERIFGVECDEDFMVMTNHYITDELRKIELPPSAIFGNKSPREIRGLPINMTSYIRKETAEKYLSEYETVGKKEIIRIHRSHEPMPEGKGGFNSICHHDPVNITAASMIFEPTERKCTICFGLPCENEYRSVVFRR